MRIFHMVFRSLPFEKASIQITVLPHHLARRLILFFSSVYISSTATYLSRGEEDRIVR